MQVVVMAAIPLSSPLLSTITCLRRKTHLMRRYGNLCLKSRGRHLSSYSFTKNAIKNKMLKEESKLRAVQNFWYYIAEKGEGADK